MSILVVGSVALDSVETPFGSADRVIGGSAVFFAAAASLLGPVRLVGVVGDDYPFEKLDFLTARGADLSGVEHAEGESFFWAARYSDDLSSRDTLETRFGVFGDFRPRVPDAFRDSRYVFLGNIDPVLQLEVLDQMREPAAVICDTMNYWIEGSREALVELLKRVDILMVNDAEARQLAGDHNLVRAARWIQERGPRLVVVKKGEHGAILFGPDWMFFVPGFPLEVIFDPTGAGDAFAGGFVGYIASVDSQDPEDLRRAMVYGSVMGSFAVESFSVDRFHSLHQKEIQSRIMGFKEMTAFEHGLVESDG
ncbi:MAG: sugar kinase [Gemmatimonadetes bacterium]|nr:sugar kinase [Gemmatimonadota bacterium]